MVQLYPTLALLSSVDLVLYRDAMLDVYVINMKNHGEEHSYGLFFQEYALFEPGCRHVAQDLMGTNKANPTAMILSATMMLRHLG